MLHLCRCLLLLLPITLGAQDHIDKLQSKLSGLPDNREKIEGLIQLSQYLQIDKPRQALKHFDQAIDLGNTLGLPSLVSRAVYGKALTYYTSARYEKAATELEARLPSLASDQQSKLLESYYLLLAQIFAKKEDLQNLRRYQRKYQALQDSLSAARADEEIAQFEEKFEDERELATQAIQEKEQAISALEQQEAINLRRQLEIAQLQTQAAELERLNAEKEQARLVREREAIDLEMSLNRKIQNRNRLIAIAFGLLLVAGILVQRIRILQQRKKVIFERQKSERLEQIDRLKDQFLANTSHELRTPLNGIIGIAESLHDGVHANDPRQQKSNLALIISSGKRLSNLVNDLLDFSKIRNDELHLDLKSIDIWSLTEIVVQVNKMMADAKGITLKNSIDKDAPAVLADESRLQQILYNLVDNAIKFSEEGTVEITAEAMDDQMEIRVKDDGIGMSDREASEIFKEFKQLEAGLDRKYSGTGLGLSITSKLVKLHGGSIWVDSAVAKGSTFSFTLPLSHENASNGELKQSLARPIVLPVQSLPTYPKITTKNANHIENQIVRILIVDDEPINHQVLKNHLSESHYQIISALDGAEAIAQLDNGQSFDLVLLDIMMPQMTGYAVCREIRKKYLASELPIIMITAKNQVADLVEALSYGANDYLAKPFSKDEFLARIKTHLDLYKINSATSRFVPGEFLRSLGYESITDVKLGDYKERDVTVFFSDIRSYTSMSEKMSPEENFRFVAAYVNRMGPIIKKFHGFVLQYLGDGIMALFLDHPDNAVAAAVAMQERLHQYNIKRKQLSRDPITVGMGLHTGPLVMGIIGDNNRNDPTTISDAVNIASRMETLTRKFGANILVSKDTMDRLSDRSSIEHRFLGKVMTKGKKELVEVFEIIAGQSGFLTAGKLQTKEIFEAGVAAFMQKDFVHADQLFKEVLAKNPDDLAASFYQFNAQVASRKASAS